MPAVPWGVGWGGAQHASYADLQEQATLAARPHSASNGSAGRVVWCVHGMGWAYLFSFFLVCLGVSLVVVFWVLGFC